MLGADIEDRRQFRDRRIPGSLLPVLAQSKVRALPEPFCLVSLPPSSGPQVYRLLAEVEAPFTHASVDDREAALVVPEAVWRKNQGDFQGAKVEKGFRVLALEGDADWATPGFLAVVTRTLAEGGVGAGLVAGRRRLHLLVPSRQMKDARIHLDLLCKQARGRLGGRRG